MLNTNFNTATITSLSSIKKIDYEKNTPYIVDACGYDLTLLGKL